MSSPITIAPHLQRALEVMSKDMAVAPEALVNQAVFAWLRINGYVVPGQPAAQETLPQAVAAAVAPPAVAPAPVAPPVAAAAASLPPPMTSTPTPAPMPATTPAAAPAAATAPAAKEPNPAFARMAEIDADLERLAKPWPAWPPEPPPEEEPEEEEEQEEAAQDEEVAQDEDAEQPHEEKEEASEQDEEQAEAQDDDAEEEEEEDPSLQENTGETEVSPPEPEPDEEEEAPAAAKGPSASDEEEPPAESTIVLKKVPIVLYLQRGDAEPIRIENERFVIGRGPHCDLIIDSPRVSREHAILTRSGLMYFIEDQNSSNGTWFNEERITKKELESGDVILLGNEEVTFFLRGE